MTHGLGGRHVRTPQRGQAAQRHGHQGLTVFAVAAVGAGLEVQPSVEPESGQLYHRIRGDVAGQNGQV